MTVKREIQNTLANATLGDFKGARAGFNKQENCLCDLCGKSIGLFQKILYTVTEGKVFPKHLRKDPLHKERSIRYRDKTAHLACVISRLDKLNEKKFKNIKKEEN